MANDRWLDNVRWDSESKQIVIEARYVLHTDGITHHNYRILSSLEDVTALVALLGHAGSASDAELLREHLGKNIPAIVKLLACATGLVPTPMPETDPEARQKDKQGTRRRSKRTTA